MNDVKVSVVASSIRPHLWKNVGESLLPNTINYEVIMVGPNAGEVPPRFKHIPVNVKPAQCYEIGFRNAIGELITWSADDACYSPHALDQAYAFWKSFNNENLVVAFRTIEDGKEITDEHRFFCSNEESLRMAPFGLMSRRLFLNLGGYDRNFICGQSENDIVMRIYEIGGTVEVCPDASVTVDHLGAHSDSKTVFRRSGYYGHDREVLEKAWVSSNTLSKKRLFPVERFTEILSETQGPRGNW